MGKCFEEDFKDFFTALKTKPESLSAMATSANLQEGTKTGSNPLHGLLRATTRINDKEEIKKPSLMGKFGQAMALKMEPERKIGEEAIADAEMKLNRVK